MTVLGPLALQRLYRTFAGHHSKDPSFFEEDTYRDQEAAQKPWKTSFLGVAYIVNASTRKWPKSARCARHTGPPVSVTARRPEHIRRRHTEMHGRHKNVNMLGRNGKTGDNWQDPYQSITEPLQEPTGSPKIAESKEPQRQRQRCWEEQGQAQGCSPVGDGCRSTAQCELQQLAICTPCGNIASVAFSGWGCAESDANHSIGVK